MIFSEIQKFTGCCRGTLLFFLLFEILEFSTESSAAGNPPRILQHPTDLVVPRNEPATLQCQADGRPPPEIYWYKDHGELVSSSSSTPSPLLSLFGGIAESEQPRLIQQNGALHFNRVVHNKKDKPDAGIYWCVAKNQFGEAKSRNATLQIAFLRDEFRRQPNASVRVASENSALLECHPPRGFPAPKTYWKRDGKELKLTGRFAMMDEGNLVISDVRPSDAGQYICVAENIAASKESHAVSLYVYSPPTVITPPQDITALADDNIVFECKVVGDPLPTVTWSKKDNRRLLTDPRFRVQDDGGLRINQVNPADEGTYLCQAENSMGSVAETAVLAVHSRPRIVLPPRDQRVVIGGAGTFDCLTNGSPAPAVFWTKEGSQILMFPGQPHGRFSVQSDGTLTISGVQKEDAGNYVCSALSVAGSAVEKAQLEVTTAAQSPPPVIVLGPANQTLAINAVATLPCRSIGTPAPSTHWLKDDIPLSLDTSPRATLSSSGTLQISDLRITDSGVFTCVASSESGRTTWSAALVVESPTNPHVMFHRMPDLTALPGAPSKPVLTNVTETAIELTWRPSPNSDDTFSTRLYRIEYFCFEEPKGWLLGSHPTTLTRFTVTGLRPDSSYVFLIRAMTPQGLMSQPSPLSDKVVTLSTGRPAIQVDVNEIRAKFARDMVELSAVRAISPTAITVQWKVLQDEKYIAAYYVKYRIHGLPDSNYTFISFQKGSSSVYTVFGLKKYTEYEIRIVPFYKEVIGKESNTLIMRTLSDVPDEAPQDVKVAVIDPTTLSVSWYPPSVHHLNGQLAGYRVSVIPTGTVPALTGNGTSPMLTRNVTAGYSDVGKEVIGNLTTGMRYRITVAARTDAGIGVSSRPLYVKMERTAAGVGELLQQPWFIGVLSGILALFLLSVLIILFLHWRKRRSLLKKSLQSHPRLYPADKTFPCHPHLRVSESGSLLPNSIVGLPFVPATSGLILSHHNPSAGPTSWLHGNTGEWTKQACDANNSRFHSCASHGGIGNTASFPCCPVHGTLLYGTAGRRGSNSKTYGDVSERLAKLETGESSLSSHGHSYPETVSVHSRRSSVDDRESDSRRSHHQAPNWADLLPPPPLAPPSPQTSEAQSKQGRDSTIDSFTSLETDLAKRMADLRRRYEMELEELNSAAARRMPSAYNNDDSVRLAMDGGRSRRLLYLQHASLDRPFRGTTRVEQPLLYSGQYFAHRIAHNLARTRSCESSINNDDERDSDESSDNGAADVEYIDDGNNGETSPCLSSEASFFLEKNVSTTNPKLPTVSNSARIAELPSLLASRESRQAPHYMHRILSADKFRKPLPLQRNSPRRYVVVRQPQDSPDTPLQVGNRTVFSGHQGVSTLSLKHSISRNRMSGSSRHAHARPKKPTSATSKQYSKVAISEPPQSVC